MLKHKVYLSPSQQPDNIGIGGYGDEQARMYPIAYALALRLSWGSNVEVAVARSGMTLEQVVAESDAWGADLHICLHSNASVKHNAKGCEVFYCPGSVVGKRLAEAVYSALSKENPNGGRRCEATAFYELKQTNAWAVYVEAGFHDVASEAEWLVKNGVAVARAIAAAVVDEFIGEV